MLPTISSYKTKQNKRTNGISLISVPRFVMMMVTWHIVVQIVIWTFDAEANADLFRVIKYRKEEINVGSQLVTNEIINRE